ncbi:MAG: hypothetical protein JW928_05060 [Candidatus Aureabacteria bacterium]|nr:hypothetical protein [Candidatus Auribacterota bacterium]
MIVLRDLLEIEDASGILDFHFEFDDILMWPFIRFYLHGIPIAREYGLHDLGEKKARPGLKEKMVYLKNTIRGNPYRKTLKAHYDIIMFCSGITNIRKDGQYFNRLSDYFAFLNKEKTLIIEDSVRRMYHTPRAFPYVGYHDFIKASALIRSRFRRKSEKDKKTAKDLLDYLEDNYPYNLDKKDLAFLESILLRLSGRLQAYYDAYNRLYDRFQPSVIFQEDACYGGRSYIAKWAKDRDIWVCELQHGLISGNHAAYNYGKAIFDSSVYNEYLPDYFLSYGEYWNDLIQLPVEKITIGNPNYWENTKTSGLYEKRDARIYLLVISGGKSAGAIKRLVADLAQISDEKRVKVFFRPHPYERLVLKDLFPDIVENDRITIDDSEDVYQSLGRSDFVAGNYSTVLFEAIGICKSVFVIDQPATDLYIPQGVIKRFSSAEELLGLIESYDPSENIDKNAVWQTDWESRYRHFIEGLIGKKT